MDDRDRKRTEYTIKKKENLTNPGKNKEKEKGYKQVRISNI